MSERKLRFGLDLDGVVYDFEGAATFLIEERFGVKVPRPWRSFSYPIEYCKNVGVPEAWDWIWTREGLGAGLFRHGHVLKGGVRAANELVNMGCELVVITKRPKQAVADTLMWLGFHDFPVSEVHILDHGLKSEVVPACDVYIDDHVSNIEDLYNNVPEADLILWPQPWNKSFARLSERIWYPGGDWGLGAWDDVFRVVKTVQRRKDLVA